MACSTDPDSQTLRCIILRVPVGDVEDELAAGAAGQSGSVLGVAAETGRRASVGGLARKAVSARLRCDKLRPAEGTETRAFHRSRLSHA